MADHISLIEMIYHMANAAKHTPAGVKMYERLVALADEHQDEGWQIKGRFLLVESAVFAGMPEVTLREFAILLGYLDTKLDVVSEHMRPEGILWSYKWALGKLPNFPNVPAERIHAALQDLETRFLSFGDHRQAVAQYHFITHSRMGNWELAERALARLENIEVTSALKDCDACFRGSRVNYLIDRGEYATAIAESAPILEGKEHCATVPSLFYHNLLVPLMLEDRHDEADEIAAKIKLGYEPKNIYTNGSMIGYLTARGRYDEAVDVFERTLPLVVAALDGDQRFRFFINARPLIEWLAAERETVTLQLPETFPLHDADNNYATAALKQWIDTQVRELEAAFNARNGNDLFTRRRERMEQLP